MGEVKREMSYNVCSPLKMSFDAYIYLVASGLPYGVKSISSYGAS